MIKKNLGYIISGIILLISLFLILNKVSENKLNQNTSSTSTVRSVENKEINEGKSNHKITYTIQEGDTLWDISVKYYGDGAKYHEIIKKNPSKTFKFKSGAEGLIYPGTELEL